MKSQNHNFLLPLPAQDGSYFAGSLTYICTHDEKGAAGYIVNRPTALDFNDLLKALSIPSTMQSVSQVFEGGPVDMSTPSILHTDDVMGTESIELGNELGLTMPFEKEGFEKLLNLIAAGDGPEKYMVMLGYAGWGEGQLDREINDNVWLTCPSTIELIFDVPADDRAQQAAWSIGIDLDMLSGDSTGHA